MGKEEEEKINRRPLYTRNRKRQWPNVRSNKSSVYPFQLESLCQMRRHVQMWEGDGGGEG
jgi:hypothetical protein